MTYGQHPWPPLGSSVGHERAHLLSVTGQDLLTVDSQRPPPATGPTQDEPKLLSIKEQAVYLGISRSAAYGL